MVSSTLGSPTNTGWKRRASAASFSTCLRYSSSVVAPMQCSSPRASAGLSRLEASIAPSALPAPTRVCISSMKRMISPSASVTSCSTALRRSSNSPRYLAPATSAPRSSAITRLSFSASGTSPLTMRSAKPSTMAVLPTPGSPISTGLFLVRRASTWMARRISSSRPITGSSLPSRAAAVMSRAYFFSASKLSSAFWLLTVRPLRRSATAASSRCASAPAPRSARPAARFRGGERHQQPVLGDELVAGAGRLLLRRVEHAHDVRGELRLAGAAARDLGLPGELGFERLLGARRVAAGGADQARRGALLVVEQRLQQVLRRDALVVLADRDGLRGLEEAPRAVGELLDVHVIGVPSGKATPPGGPARGNLPAGAAMRSHVLVGEIDTGDASLSAPPRPVARAPRTR